MREREKSKVRERKTEKVRERVRVTKIRKGNASKSHIYSLIKKTIY